MIGSYVLALVATALWAVSLSDYNAEVDRPQAGGYNVCTELAFSN